MEPPQSSGSERNSLTPAINFLRRRQLASVARHEPSPGMVTVYLGDGQFHSASRHKKTTLRQILQRESTKRSHDSIKSRIPVDFEGRALDLDTSLQDLPVQEILCLPVRDEPLTARPSRMGSNVALVVPSPAALSSALTRLSPRLKRKETSPLSELCSEMSKSIHSRAHKIGLRIYVDSFLASDALDWLEKHQHLPPDEAVAVCRGMEKQGLISHVTMRGFFDGNPDAMYRFNYPAHHAHTQRHGDSSSSTSSSSSSSSSAPPSSTTSRSSSRLSFRLSTELRAPPVSDTLHKQFWAGAPLRRNNLDNLEQNEEEAKKEWLKLYRLASYVPNIVLKHLSEHEGSTATPYVEHLRAAVVFADISGFTPLAEKLVAQGPRGVEQLSTYLNEYFHLMIDLIYNHGGDIVKFAGDALVVIWPTASEEGLLYSSLAAAQCAVSLRDHLKDFDAGGTTLKLHLGVSVGKLACMHVGAPPRIEFVVFGEPLEEAAACEEYAAPGEVYVSHKLYTLVGPSFFSIKTGRHSSSTNSNSSNAIESPFSSTPHELLEMFNPVPISPVSVPVGPESRAFLETYMPSAVPAHIDSGSPDALLADVRTVSVVFLNVDSSIRTSNVDTDAAVDKFHRIFTLVQEEVAKHGGAIRQFVVDDKGTVLIAVFGLPPTTHEDDPHRALLFAMKASKRLLISERLQASVGVTTGHVYCGAVGSDERREYAVVGDVVNLAARLMSKAHGQILCDRTTHQACLSRFTFKALPPVALKGKQKLVDIFIPRAEFTAKDGTSDSIAKIAPGSRQSSGLLMPLQSQAARLDIFSSPLIRQQSNMTMIGRKKDLESVRQVVEEVIVPRPILFQSSKDPQKPHGHVLCIEGDFGLGKSRMAAEMIENAKLSKLNCVIGYGFSSDSKTPFACFRGIVCRALGIDADDFESDTDFSKKTTNAIRALRRLVGDGMKPYEPLLADIIPELAIPKTEIASGLSGGSRAEKIAELILHLIDACKFNVILLENAQWMDSMSWWLAGEMVRHWCTPKHLLCICIRPPSLTESVLSNEYEAFKNIATTTLKQNFKVVRLQSFSEDNVKELVGQKLGLPLSSIPDSVSTPIFQLSSGNPMVLVELVNDLVQAGELVVVNRTCELIAKNRFSEYQDVKGAESTLQAVMKSKIDGLPASHQLILKIGAVIGHEFRLDLLFDILRDISTDPVDETQLVSALSELESKGFISAFSAHPLSYVFQLPGVPLILYNRMLFAQRKAIHQKIAEWLSNNESLSGPNQTALAYHWKGAEAWSTALAFMTRCTERALRQGAYAEAVDMLNDCIDTYRKLDPDEAAEQRVLLASFYRSLGVTWYNLRNFTRSTSMLEEGLKTLNLPLPRAGAPLAMSLIDELRHNIRRVKRKYGSMDHFEGYLWKQVSKRNTQAMFDDGSREAAMIYLQFSIMLSYDSCRDEAAFCAISSMKNAAILAMPAEYTAAGSVVLSLIGNYNIPEIVSDLSMHIGDFATTLEAATDSKSMEAISRYHLSVASQLSCDSYWNLAAHNLSVSVKMAISASRFQIAAEALLMTGFVSFWKGEFIRLKSQMDEALQLGDLAEDVQFVTLLKHLRIAMLFCQGHVKKAKKVLDEVVEVFKQAEHSPEHASKSLPTKARIPVVLLPLLVAQHIYMHDADELARSSKELADSIAARAQIHMLSSLSHLFLCQAAAVLAKANKSSPEFINSLLSIVSRYAERFVFFQPIVHLYQGDIDQARGKHQDAADNWRKALELAQKRSMRYFGAQAMLRFEDNEKFISEARAILKQQGAVISGPSVHFVNFPDSM